MMTVGEVKEVAESTVGIFITQTVVASLQDAPDDPRLLVIS